jgi:hypothetical protein
MVGSYPTQSMDVCLVVVVLYGTLRCDFPSKKKYKSALLACTIEVVRFRQLSDMFRWESCVSLSPYVDVTNEFGRLTTQHTFGEEKGKCCYIH